MAIAVLLGSVHHAGRVEVSESQCNGDKASVSFTQPTSQIRFELAFTRTSSSREGIRPFISVLEL